MQAGLDFILARFFFLSSKRYNGDMDGISIKPCTMKAFSKVLPLFESQASIFDYATKRRILQLTTKTLDLGLKNPLIFVAECEGSVVGFLGFRQDDNNPTKAELYGQIIKKGYDKQGLGSKMLQMGIENLKKAGADQVTVLLKASSPKYVTSFYEKAGFEPVFDDKYTGASDESKAMSLIFKQGSKTSASIYPV